MNFRMLKMVNFLMLKVVESQSVKCEMLCSLPNPDQPDGRKLKIDIDIHIHIHIHIHNLPLGFYLPFTLVTISGLHMIEQGLYTLGQVGFGEGQNVIFKVSHCLFLQ